MNKHIDENKIEQIIKANKPQVSRDEKFKGILRAQTLGALSEAPIKKTFSFQAWIPGAVALAVILIGVAVALPQGGTPSLLSSGVSVSKVGSNAFGTLNNLSGTGNANGTTANTGESAGGAEPATAAPMMAAAGTSGSSGSAGSAGFAASPAIIARPILPPNQYPQITPKYIYKGDTITQNQSSMDVLKRVIAPISADKATAAIEGSDFGLVNLGSFGNMQLQNITLSEDQNFGYTINLDLTDGSFSIYQNYSTWPQDNNPQPLTASNVPSNDAIIKIANDFLKAHSFDMGSYGVPTVVNNISYAMPVEADGGAGGTSSGASVNMPMIPYYPDTVSVTYPLVVNGNTVYDTSGNVTGLDVEVNIRYNRVSNVSGVTTQNYQASSYTAITDIQKIISLAETPNAYPVIYNGALEGVSGSGGSNGSAKTVEVDLGTPTLGYAEMYTYTDNTSNEFLVPAFIFPVTSDPGQYVPSKNVVVPLIADFINNSGPSKIVPLTGTAMPPSAGQ